MQISISPETRKLLDAEMKRSGYPTADDLVRAALANMHAPEIPLEELDEETLAAIQRAESQSARGEAIPADEAFDQLRRKHFGN